MISEYDTHLVVLRHGQTDWNFERRFQGHADVPLNDAGRQQALDVRPLLAGYHFDAVYSSTASRALETARIVRPTTSIRQDARLMEINVGSWAGKTHVDVIAEMPEYPQLYANGIDFRRSSTGETLAEMVERGLPAFEEIAAAHEGGSVLIVSHGLFLNRVVHALLGVPGRVLGGFGNAHFSELGHAHGAWRLLAHNVGVRSA